MLIDNYKHKFKYGKEEFDSILKKFRENRFNYALEQLNSYLKKYPEDTCAYLYYVHILIIVGNLEEAEKILNSKIVTLATRKEDIEKAFYLRIKLFICKKEYQECYDYIKKNMDLFYNKDSDNDLEIMIFLKKQLNQELFYEDMDTYFLKQLVCYQKAAFFSHIGKYLYTSDGLRKKHFKKDFPVEKVYERLIELIPNELKTNDSTLINSYIFKLDKCGIVDGREVNYFRVVAIINTNQITTMIPYENRERLPYTDFNFYNLEEVKVKTMSQVEKFNQRYKKR